MRFFDRVVGMLNSLNYGYRFGLIGLLLGFPIIFMALMIVGDLNQDIASMEERQVGMHYNRLLKDLLRDIQQHRGMTQLYLSDEESSKSSLEKIQLNISQDYKKINEYKDIVKDPFQATDALIHLKKEWQQIEEIIGKINSQNAMNLHSNHIEQITNLMLDIADESELLLSKTDYTYYMINDVIKTLPLLTDQLGQLRAQGIAIIERGEISEEERAALLSMYSSVQYTLKECKYGPSLENDLKDTSQFVFKNTLEFLNYVQLEFIQSDDIHMNARNYFEFATETIDRVFDLYDIKAEGLEQKISQQMNKLKWIRAIFISLFLVGLLISTYCCFGFYYSILSSTESMHVFGYMFSYKYLFSPQIKQTEAKYKEAEQKLFEVERKLPQYILQAQEKERKRVSRELHDGIGQSLYSIMVALDMLDYEGEKAEIYQSMSIQTVKKITSAALKDVSRISRSLRPIILDDLGFIAALQAYIEEFQMIHDLQVKLEVTGEKKRLHSKVETALYRICQEALTNVAKYAKANTVNISIHKSNEEDFISITDDGIGFSVNDNTLGLGLLSMIERTKALGGKIEINSKKNKGTSISIRIPRNK